MARNIRDELQSASTFLKEAGQADYASAVDSVLARGGWTLLRGGAGSSSGYSNLPITTDEDTKDALKAAAAEIGETLTSVALDGYRKVLDGSWVPPKRVGRRASLTSPVRRSPKSTLNLNIPNELRQQIQEWLPELEKQVGYRITEPSMALLWMTDELGVQDPTGRDSFKTLLVKSLRDYFIEEAERRGVLLKDVLGEGIRAVQDGSWVPSKPVRGRERAADDKPARLTVDIGNELLTALHELTPAVSEKLGYKLYPGTLGLLILKHRLGEPGTE